VNPTNQVYALTSGLVSGIPSSIDFSYLGGLDFSFSLVYESPVVSLTRFEPGLDPLPGLTECNYVCIGFEPGALFDGDCWGTQQKYLLVADSCAQLSLLEVFNDSSAFSEPAMTMGEYFGGVIAPGRVSGCFVSPPQISSSRGNACVVGREGLKDVGVSNHSVHIGTQCARDRTDLDSLGFGEDIYMDHVVEFSELAMVGMARGKRLGASFLCSWVE
jgi:hypothetical protein